MNKKILSLLFLLILLVSVTVSYAYFSQPAHQDNQTTTDGAIDDTTMSQEIDSTLLDEGQGVEIGDMI